MKKHRNILLIATIIVGLFAPLLFSSAIHAEENKAISTDQELEDTYYEGFGWYLGVPRKDYKKAFSLLTTAAEQGHPEAPFYIAAMYAKGQGVPKNYIRAYAWWNLSAALGGRDVEAAMQNLDLLSEMMTAHQIGQAQELSYRLQVKIDRHKKSRDSSPQTVTLYEPAIKGSGTGFIITKDGYILTCHHVIDEAETIKVIVGDRSYPAKVVRADKYNDMALLKISGSFSALAFSGKRSAKMGQSVFTIGYPNPDLQGKSAKLTKGTVNSLSGVMDDLRLYQISTPVQPGNSGGPLLDMNGNVTGVIVAMLDTKTAFKISGSLPQNVNYAVKSSYAQALLDTLPEISDNLLQPSQQMTFDAVVEKVKKSVVMIVTYE